jgi:hypothetical protein
MLVSITAVCLIRLAALSILHPNKQFAPLTPGPPIFDTVIAVGAAIVVFARIWNDSLDPARDYRSLAAKVLIVSFVPDVALAVMHGFGGGWPEALALMTMHIAVWAVCVTMLPALCWAPRRHIGA